jgi:hypothetical protein
VAYAEQTQGASSTLISNTGAATSSATILNSAGGNASAVNIVGTSNTDKWTGFYGNISVDIRLSDSAGNNLYRWTVSSTNGSVVYVTNGTVTNWSSLSAARLVDFPSYLAENAADNYSNTFTGNEAFTSNLRIVNNVDYAYTLNSSGLSSEFKTYAMTADINSTNNDNATMVFAGKVVSQANSFIDIGADFQIIAPANSETSYFFYLELP